MYKSNISFFSIVLFFFMYNISFSINNPKGMIYGKIINKDTKKPIQDVSVVVMQNNVIITGMLTNKKGFFSISDLNIGTYDLLISFMGYKTFETEFTITSEKDKIDFKTIELSSVVNKLDAVEIRSQTTNITQEIDKQVIHVGNDLLATGSTATEILSNLPSVSVDGDNKISYRGSPNVMIYVDGKPTAINSEDVLNQIPANTIKKIELISNPSARYNPEGLNGIINIILIKNSNLGFHAKVNSGITKSKKWSSNSSLNLNFKQGKFNFYANLGYIDKNKKRNGYFHHYYNNIFDDFTVENQKKSKLIKLGTDFNINKQQTLSFYTYQNFLDTNVNKNSITTYPSSIASIKTDNVFKNKEHIYNLNYVLGFNKEGEKLEFEINYDTNKVVQNNQENNLTTNSLNYLDAIKINRDYTIVNLDYQNSFKKDYKLELGIESRIRKADNKMETTRFGVNPNSFFEYDRNENSIYATLSKKINKQFSYKIGSRLESYTYQSFLDNTKIYSKDYLTLYPSFSFVFQKNKKNRFQIGYSKHIFRPEINQVNPTSVWSSSVMTFKGNPSLKPTFVDYYELIYIYKFKKGVFRLNPFYQVNYNTIYQSISKDPLDSSRLLLSFSNDKINYIYAVEIGLYYKITNWWSLNIANYITNFEQKGIVNGVVKNVKNTNFNTSLYQSFILNKKLNMTLFGKYNSAKKTLQFNKRPTYRIDFATRYKILKNKGSLTLRFSDIFDTSKYTFNVDSPFQQKGLMELDSQSVYFGFSYDFGSNKVKNRRRKSHEKQEINGGGIF